MLERRSRKGYVLLAAALLCSLTVLLHPVKAEAAGLQEINGSIYSINEDGSFGTGWISYNGYVYYFSPADGTMQVGWINDNGTWYYCDAKGRKLFDGVTPDGHLLDKNGARVFESAGFTPDQVTFNPTKGVYQLNFYRDMSVSPSVDTDEEYFTLLQGTYYEALPVTDYNTLDPTRAQIIAVAKTCLGVPYVWGGSDPATGLDCSGFTMLTYNTAAGIALPHHAQDQQTYGTEVALSDMQPGDLLFYSTLSGEIYHVAIYEGNGLIIHADGHEVAEAVMPEHEDGVHRYWSDYPTSIKNILGN